MQGMNAMHDRKKKNKFKIEFWLNVVSFGMLMPIR